MLRRVRFVQEGSTVSDTRRPASDPAARPSPAAIVVAILAAATAVAAAGASLLLAEVD